MGDDITMFGGSADIEQTIPVEDALDCRVREILRLRPNPTTQEIARRQEDFFNRMFGGK